MFTGFQFYRCTTHFDWKPHFFRTNGYIEFCFGYWVLSYTYECEDEE